MAESIDIGKFFPALKEPLKGELVAAFEVQEHAAGHVFGHVGLVEKREQNAVWILLEGEIGVETEAKVKGQVPVQRKIEPGEIFGIISFLRGGSRTATMTARTKVKVAALTQLQYHQAVRPKAELDSSLLMVLGGQLARDVRLCNERLAKAVKGSAAK
jgi:CRP-like cAMP-binding protein